jgi:hypothetical protein
VLGVVMVMLGFMMSSCLMADDAEVFATRLRDVR